MPIPWLANMAFIEGLTGDHQGIIGALSAAGFVHAAMMGVIFGDEDLEIMNPNSGYGGVKNTLILIE